MKGFVNIEATQNFEKISKQISKNFSGEKGKKIYLLFLERIDFVTFLENVAL